MPRMNGKRLALSSRCTPELKQKLLAASEAGGRSLMQEIEFRLEQSFAIAEATRTIRETIRQEMRAEFEARRDLEDQAAAEHQRQVLVALGFKETVN